MDQDRSIKATGVDEIEHTFRSHGTLRDETTAYDHDDIHQAALADNPEHAERPNLATLLSIMVSWSPRRRDSKVEHQEN